MTRINNSSAPFFIADKRPFHGSNFYGLVTPSGMLYEVYSFGPRWPLVVYDFAAGRWAQNSSVYPSSSTRRHAKLAARPGALLLPVEDLLTVIRTGSISRFVALASPNDYQLQADTGGQG